MSGFGGTFRPSFDADFNPIAPTLEPEPSPFATDAPVELGTVQTKDYPFAEAPSAAADYSGVAGAFPAPVTADADGEIFDTGEPPRADSNDPAINAHLRYDWDAGTRQEYAPTALPAPAVTVAEVTPVRAAAAAAAARATRRLGWDAETGVAMLRKYSANPTKRVRTGLDHIDQMLGGGIGIGEVCYLLGKSGSGKSLLGQNILENNTEVPALFASLEMSGTLTMLRSVSMWAGLNYRDLFADIEAGRFDEALMGKWAAAHPVHYTTTLTGLSLPDLSLALAEAEEVTGSRPVLVVIDYMELIGSEGDEAIDKITATAQLLKGWAKREEVAVAVLHQMNKTVRHGDAPDEDSARYGGFTEADIVIGVFRPHKWTPATAKAGLPLTDEQRTYLEGFLAVNLIKNRPRIDLLESGYLVPISPSGRLHNPAHITELPRSGAPVPTAPNES